MSLLIKWYNNGNSDCCYFENYPIKDILIEQDQQQIEEKYLYRLLKKGVDALTYHNNYHKNDYGFYHRKVYLTKI